MIGERFNPSSSSWLVVLQRCLLQPSRTGVVEESPVELYEVEIAFERSDDVRCVFEHGSDLSPKRDHDGVIYCEGALDIGAD